jgi:tRNA (cmo5U34)-methyltransferase
MVTHTGEPTGRRDRDWQRPAVASGYQAIRDGVPFVDAQFEVMHRLFDVARIRVRRLLDLGSGDGIVTAVIAERHPVAHAVLVDFSESMMAAAHARFPSRASGPKADFVPGDLRAVDWHDRVVAAGPYDAVVSRYAIHHLPDEDKRALYMEVLGWLVPGGMFVNIEHVSSASDLYEAAHDRLMIESIVAAEGPDADAAAIEKRYWTREDAQANILAPVDVQTR